MNIKARMKRLRRWIAHGLFPEMDRENRSAELKGYDRGIENLWYHCELARTCISQIKRHIERFQDHANSPIMVMAVNGQADSITLAVQHPQPIVFESRSAEPVGIYERRYPMKVWRSQIRIGAIDNPRSIDAELDEYTKRLFISQTMLEMAQKIPIKSTGAAI